MFERVEELVACVEAALWDEEVVVERAANRLDPDYDASASCGYRCAAFVPRIGSAAVTTRAVYATAVREAGLPYTARLYVSVCIRHGSCGCRCAAALPPRGPPEQPRLAPRRAG